MKYLSIAKEATLCREAFKDAKIGDLVWFCHHEMAIELLIELPEIRIQYILFYKSEKEQAIRLHWFRPCEIKLPPWLDAAYSKWAAARSKWDAARSKWDAARAEHAEEINALVKLHLPGCPWNGSTLL